MNKVLAFIICVCIIGCTKTKYIETEKVVTEYKHSVDTLHDSIYHDVYHTEYMKGDTVFSVVKEYVYKDRYKVKVDTFTKQDSIPYYIKEYIEKPSKTSFFDKVKGWLFYPMLILTILSVLAFIYRKML